jgi:hypothetical protein
MPVFSKILYETQWFLLRRIWLPIGNPVRQMTGTLGKTTVMCGWVNIALFLKPI